MGLVDELRVVSPSSEAQLIAEKMPLVHFPAGDYLREWKQWRSFRSRSMRGEPQPGDGMFADLRANHVFTYAGPSCFSKAGHVGDAVMYFSAGAEAGVQGTVGPFDSGSLEDPNPCLQPFATLPVAERWAVFGGSNCEIAEWRSRLFAPWLSHCYNENPSRYMETTVDRYADGFPDRTIPPEIAKHNNASVAAAGSRCADRRAWTWEVRLAEPLPYSRGMMIQCKWRHRRPRSFRSA